MGTKNSAIWGKTPVMPDTKHRRPTPSEPLYVVLDSGNTDIKAMLHEAWGEEIVFPHAVRKVSDAEYGVLVDRYSNRPAVFEGSAIFKMSGQGYVIGQHATQAGRGERLLGANKYRRDHLGALLMASLLQLYPKSHNDVRVVFLHPVEISTAAFKAIKESLLGEFSVETADGRVLSYRVRSLIPIEEAVAGFQTFALTTSGKAYADPSFRLVPNTEILVIDVGGGISNVVPCVINASGEVEINIAGARVIDAGIQDVMRTLEAELKSSFAELSKVTKIPPLMLSRALTEQEVEIRGSRHNCAAQVTTAMQAIARPLESMYNNDFSSGIEFKAIIIGGGGGAASYSYISENVLQHQNVFPAEKEPARMRYSNIRGASKGLIAHLAQR